MHRLPLEKGLPALPRLGVTERASESVDGWMSGNRDFYQEENINQGPSAAEKNQLFYMFFTFNLFRFFPKGMQMDFSVSL